MRVPVPKSSSEGTLLSGTADYRFPTIQSPHPGRSNRPIRQPQQRQYKRRPRDQQFPSATTRCLLEDGFSGDTGQ
jgi:hypothetical protein